MITRMRTTEKELVLAQQHATVFLPRACAYSTHGRASPCIPMPKHHLYPKTLLVTVEYFIGIVHGQQTFPFCSFVDHLKTFQNL